MHGLPDLQHRFLAALAGEPDPELLQDITANGIDGGRRLQIYRNNMYSSLTEALRAVYPVVDRLVGTEFFDFAARRYITEQPSRSGDIHRFGASFGRFLHGFQPARGLPYLADVSALEWAYHEVFHAADRPGFALQALATIPESQQDALRLRLNPASRLLESRYPVLRIWQVNQPDAAGTETVHLEEGGDRLLVLRGEQDIGFHRLAPGCYRWLTALQQGATLASASELARDVDPDFDLARELHRHISCKTLVDYYY